VSTGIAQMVDNAACMLCDAAEAREDATAVVDSGDSSSYGQLAARAGALGELLVDAGVRPGDRVALLLRREADAAAAYFAALSVGAIAVVIDDRLRARQIEHILTHSSAVVLLTAADLLERLQRPLRTAARVRRVDDADPAGRLEPIRRIPPDLAQIIYTSGSTGLPKGVVLSHENLRAGTAAVGSYLGIESEDRLAGILPLAFDYGLNQLLCAVNASAAWVVERSPVPQRVVRTLHEASVTVLAAVPPLWLQLLGVSDFSAPLPALRTMTNSGGRLPVAAVRRLRRSQPQAALVLMYGLTEAFRSTYLAPERVDAKPDSIGRAIPGAEVIVLREDMTLCEVREHGQLAHRGPTVAVGYWDDEQATASTFVSSPLKPPGAPATERVVLSGDLVYRDEDGDLFFVARADRMIKTLGYRVSPDEVVEAIHASGEVADAIVGAEPDELRGAQIVAYVVLRAGGSCDRLRSFLVRELPTHMQPARIELRDALARTPSGKHDVARTAGRA
jgi:amino acid adenylation domain-containing protein